jgi:hypothetical protein
MLGNALIRSLTRKAYAEATPDALAAWARMWRDVAVRHPDLSLATRVFNVGVQYLISKDGRVLLDLLQEERSILRDLFRLNGENEGGGVGALETAPSPWFSQRQGS